jgi:hypothetical protein
VTQNTAVTVDLENIRASLLLLGVTRGHVLPNQTAAGLSVDANPENTETDNTVFIRFASGMTYSVAATAEIDISALTGGGDTVGLNKYGALWHFVDAAATIDVETSVATETSTSAIAALASYSTSTNTLPVLATQVPLGVVYLLADGGAHTWGTTSITSQTETYVDFLGLPGVETSCASIALDAAAATFTYGAGVCRLGSGTRISYTGKANVALPTGTAVATGKTGAWLIYVLADDVEYAQQLGATYADLAPRKPPSRPQPEPVPRAHRHHVRGEHQRQRLHARHHEPGCHGHQHHVRHRWSARLDAGCGRRPHGGDHYYLRLTGARYVGSRSDDHDPTGGAGRFRGGADDSAGRDRDRS